MEKLLMTKNRMILQIAMVCLIVFGTVATTRAQIILTNRQSETPARAAINAILWNSFRGCYQVHQVLDLDSLQGDMRVFNEPLENPYGTLSHCFFFTTEGRDTTVIDPSLPEGDIVGLFRNGAIIAYIGDVTSGVRGHLYAIRDINNDGSVDILTQWGTDDPIHSQLWIHSWDGTSLRRLNAVQDRWVENDRTDESVIVGETNSFVLFDADGDGVLEIKSLEVEDGSLTWSWNGQFYGSWPNTPHLSEATWLPRNNFSITVGCSVGKPSGLFEYSYNITNAPTSRQRINELCLEQIVDSAQVLSPSGWQRGGVVDSNLRLGWHARVTDHRGLVLPGQTRDGFEMLSLGLPSIVKFAAQADNDLPDYEMLSDAQLWSGMYNDIANNAVWGQTIGPRTPPPVESFGSLFLTDTLLSYTTRSRALSWILDQPTADRYTGLFNRIHLDLDQQQKSMALLRVDTVLTQVHQDSASHLTSEAYALLRFNAEYLQTLIGEDPLPIQLWYFTATVIADRHVELEWGTLSEQNNYGFFVQKSQNETSGFTDIPGSFVAGHGTTNDPHEYSWIDTSTSPGQWYYRLKQMDFDGTLHYTDAERVYIPEELQRTEIVNFKGAVLSDNSVSLEWTTLSEYLCEGFYVQRKADGEEDFQDVNGGFVPGHGTTDKEQLYGFTDSEAKKGKWYYRLKHQGDGSEWYSDTIHVAADDTEIGPFSAEPLIGQQVRLDWTTRREVDNRYFEIQVSRGDSLRYRPVPSGRVLGHGTSTQRWKYTYRDSRSSSGIWYYRLKQVNGSRQARYTRGIRVSVR